MAYQSLYPATSTAAKSPGTGYQSLYGAPVRQAPSASELAASRANEQPATSNSAPQKSTSLMSKIVSGAKNVGKGFVEGAKNTGEKALNTVTAGGAGVIGLGTAGVQAAIGNKKGASTTLAATQQTMNDFLNKGVGGKGAYLTSKQAASQGTGVKGIVNDVAKPVAQGATDLAPYVIPVGKAAKGASLLAKMGRGALENAVVSGGASAANDALNGRLKKEGGAEFAKNTALGAALGGLFPVLHEGARGVKTYAKEMVFNKKTAVSPTPNVLNDKQVEDLTKTTKIPVEDRSSGTILGKVTKKLPVSDTTAPVPGKPSVKGYSDTDFRLQFNDGAKRLVESQPSKWNYLDPHFNNVTDPLSRVVGVLSHASDKGAIRTAVEHLLPDINSTAKNSLVRDLGKAKTHQETADLLWDAAKNHEDSLPKPDLQGTPIVKQISFDEPTTIKSAVDPNKVGTGLIKPGIKNTPRSELAISADTVHKPDAQKVNQYVKQIKDGEPIEPIIIHTVNGQKFVVDGQSRLAAAEKLGIDHVPTVEKASSTPTDMPPGEAPLAEKSVVPITPVPAEKTISSVPVEKATVEPPATVPDRGTSKVASSVQEKAVARGLKNDFGEAGGYDKVTIADQSAKAVKVANDRPLLDKIISGEKPLPDGLRATALIKAVEEHPELSKDVPLLNRLSQAEHLTGESSRSAQELRLAAERSPHNPVEAIRNIRKAREAAVERKTGKSVAKAQDHELKAIRAAKATVPKPTKETFASFVESLKC